MTWQHETWSVIHCHEEEEAEAETNMETPAELQAW